MISRSDTRTLIPHPLDGSLHAISSKSDVHRLLICASLADGASRIRFHAALSEDMCATIGVLRAMGAEIEYADTTDGGTITVTRPVSEHVAPTELDCHESGSTARFLLPLASRNAVGSAMVGSGKLPERPFAPLCEALEAAGARFSSHALPLTLLQAPTSRDFFEIRGDISSQYISGLLFLLPLCGAEGIRLSTPLESSGYVDMTAKTMEAFGVSVKRSENTLRTFGSYRAPKEELQAEGDWSNAAFWLAAATDAHPITVCGMDMRSAQPDRRITDILTDMGMRFELHGSVVTAVSPHRTHGTHFDASASPDLVPIVCVRAAVSEGETVISGTRRLRLKESDRVDTVCRLISSLGGDIRADEDHIYIRGVPSLRGGETDSFGDHRIAMSAAIASVFCREPVVLRSSGAVGKSYPQFFEHFTLLGGLSRKEDMQ